jgi:hypothetical protein
MTDRDIMQQALDALQTSVPTHDGFLSHCKAMNHLRIRLAQPEKGPVAWEDVLGAIARGWTHDDNKHKTMDVQLAVAIAKEIQDMVIAPPQRKPLKLREIEKCIYDANNDPIVACRNVEAAHGIKENT